MDIRGSEYREFNFLENLYGKVSELFRPFALILVTICTPTPPSLISMSMCSLLPLHFIKLLSGAKNRRVRFLPL